MSALTAENNFHRGLAALAECLPEAAAGFFMKAMQIDGRLNSDQPDMRYLSYYGLSLAQSNQANSVAIEACERAARERPMPAILLNLGRVYLLAGEAERALVCLQRGVSLAPSFLPLRRELSRADRRGRPTIPALGRSHPVNCWIGRLRAWWSR